MIQLSDHFNCARLLRFTLPSIAMMIFTSIYGVVDGFFVSNFVGKTPFTAVNFIYPFLMVLGAVGFMFGTGGGALIAKTMGEKRDDKANELFSFFVFMTAASGVVIALLGIAFIRPIAAFLGADGVLLEQSVLYGRIILLALPACMLQFEFQSFFVTAEKPKLGLYITILSGVTNIALDALLVAVLPLGLVGAAAATALSQVVGGLLPLAYFGRTNSSRLALVKFRFDGRSLLLACVNGSSELLNNISMSLVSMLYNVQLLRLVGEDGVAAYGVLMYVIMIFLSAFIGYSVGMAPIVSYHYGAGSYQELRGVRRRSLGIIAVFALLMFGAAELLAEPLSMLFVGYDPGLLALTLRGFLLYSFNFLFAGFGIFGSAFFTALNNGPVSALMSFLRTMVFQVAAVLLLPIWLGIDGIWLSIVVAEGLAALVTFVVLALMRKRYQY